MNLPQCFLADLPAGAELTPGLIQEAWFALERNREKHLAPLDSVSVVRVLAEAARLWLEANSPFMETALKLGPTQLGFSKQTLETGLRQLFGSITASQLESWIEQDLAHPRRLDEFCAAAGERGCRRRSKAVGPPTLAHITAGNIPSSSVMSMSAGLLVRSAQFVKCATGTSLIPRLFAHSLREVDPHVGSCLELAEWPRRREDLLAALLAPATCVTATGTDDAVAAIGQRVPVHKRFIGYGHRISFAFVDRASLTESALPTLLDAVAEDVCAWNQLGCLSPHVIYVEAGGRVSAEEFGTGLGAALTRTEENNPRGLLSERDTASLRSRRSFYEIRAAHSSDTLLWQSRDSTAWTVVFEADPRFQTSCLNRFVYVKRVDNLQAALQAADEVRDRVSTIALTALGIRSADMTERLAEWGARRICRVGSMQKPPILWRHDGRPALDALIAWTDLEEE